MDKVTVVSKLTELGYEAAIESNIVFLYNTDLSPKDCGEMLRELGYEASYGLKSKEIKGESA